MEGGQPKVVGIGVDALAHVGTCASSCTTKLTFSRYTVKVSLFCDEDLLLYGPRNSRVDETAN